MIAFIKSLLRKKTAKEIQDEEFEKVIKRAAELHARTKEKFAPIKKKTYSERLKEEKRKRSSIRELDSKGIEKE